MNKVIKFIRGTTMLYDSAFDWGDGKWEWEAFWRDQQCKFDDLWDE